MRSAKTLFQTADLIVERTKLGYTTTLEAVIALLAKPAEVGAELETLRQVGSRGDSRASGVLDAALYIIPRSS